MEENKEVKTPPASEEKPVIKTEVPPTPPAGEEKKDNTEEVKAVLSDTSSALEKAEKRIIELKRELKARGKPQAESDEDQVALAERVAKLEAGIAEFQSNLESNFAETTDKSIEEIQSSRRKITELSASLVAKNTVSVGEGIGGNKDPLTPPQTGPKPLAVTPEEKAVLARRGMDEFGKKLAK